MGTQYNELENLVEMSKWLKTDPLFALSRSAWSACAQDLAEALGKLHVFLDRLIEARKLTDSPELEHLFELFERFQQIVVGYEVSSQGRLWLKKQSKREAYTASDTPITYHSYLGLGDSINKLSKRGYSQRFIEFLISMGITDKELFKNESFMEDYFERLQKQGFQINNVEINEKNGYFQYYVTDGKETFPINWEFYSSPELHDLMTHELLAVIKIEHLAESVIRFAEKGAEGISHLKKCPYCNGFYVAKNLRRNHCYSQKCHRKHETLRMRKYREDYPIK